MQVVWYSVKDGDDDYYWNPATGETQWEKPKRATILTAADGGEDDGRRAAVGGERKMSGAKPADAQGAPHATTSCCALPTVS